jgi:hypothetical protein
MEGGHSFSFRRVPFDSVIFLRSLWRIRLLSSCFCSLFFLTLSECLGFIVCLWTSFHFLYVLLFIILWDLSMSHILIASSKSWTEIALSPLSICSSRSTTAMTAHFVIWNHCRFSGESVKGQYVAWCWGRSVQYGRWSSRSTGEETISGVSQHVRIPTNNRFKIIIPCSSKLDSM